MTPSKQADRDVRKNNIEGTPISKMANTENQQTCSKMLSNSAVITKQNKGRRKVKDMYMKRLTHQK